VIARFIQTNPTETVTFSIHSEGNGEELVAVSIRSVPANLKEPGDQVDAQCENQRVENKRHKSVNQRKTSDTPG
jgi:hypothetical protein